MFVDPDDLFPPPRSLDDFLQDIHDIVAALLGMPATFGSLAFFGGHIMLGAELRPVLGISLIGGVLVGLILLKLASPRALDDVINDIRHFRGRNQPTRPQQLKLLPPPRRHPGVPYLPDRLRYPGEPGAQAPHAGEADVVNFDKARRRKALGSRSWPRPNGGGNPAA